MHWSKWYVVCMASGMLLAGTCSDADDKKGAPPPPPPKKEPVDTSMAPPQDPVLITGVNNRPPRPGGSRSVVPAGFEDAMFERYVDIGLIGAAIVDVDAELLTDLGLQLAEGERILLRRHQSGLTASAVLSRALNLAIDHGDQKTQDRLKKVALAIADKEIRETLSAAAKVGGTSRGDEQPFVPLDTLTADGMIQIKWYLNGISRVLVTCDRSALDVLEVQIRNDSSLPDLTKQALLVRIMHVREQLGISSPQDELLRQLEHDHWRGLIDPPPPGPIDPSDRALQGPSRGGIGDWVRNKILEEVRRREEEERKKREKTGEPERRKPTSGGVRG